MSHIAGCVCVCRKRQVIPQSEATNGPRDRAQGRPPLSRCGKDSSARFFDLPQGTTPDARDTSLDPISERCDVVKSFRLAADQRKIILGHTEHSTLQIRISPRPSNPGTNV